MKVVCSIVYTTLVRARMVIGGFVRLVGASAQSALDSKLGQGPQTRISITPWYWCHSLLSVPVFVSMILTFAIPQTSPAAVFKIPSGDVDALITAINTANTNGEADVIKLAPGTYTLTEVDNPTDGPNGLPLITSDITIKSRRRGAIERGEGAPSFRILHIAQTGTLRMSRLVIRGGRLGAMGDLGAGILNKGTLIITHSLISENDSADGAGGLWSTQTGRVVIRHSTFTNNNSGSSDITGGILNNGTLTMKESQVIEGAGTGITNTSEMTITKSVIADYTGFFTAGIRNFGKLTMTTSIVRDNISFFGGGILNDRGGDLTIRRSLILRNQTESNGGGILNDGGNLTIRRSLILRNQAEGDGGGIFNDDGTVTLVQTIIADNIPNDCTGCP